MDCLTIVQGFAGPVATIIAAAAAVYVTRSLGVQQLKIAKQQVLIADGQGKIAAARLNFDYHKQRYAVYEAARSFLTEAVASDHVDAARVIRYNIETADAVFLFEDDMVRYLDGLRDKVLRLRVLKAQAQAADEADNEEKRQRIVDLEADVAIELSSILTGMADRFKPYLKLGSV
jgi:hypothetical protein